MKISSFLSILPLGTAVAAQSFISPPQDLEVVISEKFPGAKISYKEVNDLCETTKGVKSYSGYVELPKEFLPDAGSWPEGTSGNFFFWYFEARNDPRNAPTSIYMGGGPGYTTFDGSAVFPCYFNPDSNSTTLNEYSWNNNVNMLYIDQPLTVGFSYTSLANGTWDVLTKTFTELEEGEELPALNLTTRQATLNNKVEETATMTTMSSSRYLWRFAQVWFNEFPKYETTNDAIAVWAVSYGGLFAPLFSSYTVDQNAIIKEGNHSVVNATNLNIATTGVINGLIDSKAFMLGYPNWGRNNTYGIEIFTEEVAEQFVEGVNDPNEGCYVLIDQCRELAAAKDPEHTGLVADVNEICVAASSACFGLALALFESNPHNYYHFDITSNLPASHPTEYNTAFFNQPWVQKELGVRLNYTREQETIQGAFLGVAGDVARYNTSYISNLLDNGVHVAMVYGDRDYRCNWFSAEDASLEIEHADMESFAAAGYASIQLDSDSSDGGFVRESGNLSFSRVFQAGHSAGGYQPETVGAIFQRAIFRQDVATGKTDLTKLSDVYSSEGKSNVRGVMNELPDQIENICYVMAPEQKCTDEQIWALGNGTAVTKDWVVVEPKGTKGTRGPLLNNTSTESESDSESESGDKGSDGTVDKNASTRMVGSVSSVLAIALAVASFMRL